MKLVFHGGKCCGIKTIHSLDSPGDYCGALDKLPPCDVDQNGGEVASSKRFFTDAAPSESKKERLDRYIKFCDSRRPHGIIEIVLAQKEGSGWGMQQLRDWGPLLRKRRFRCVSDCYNSNSGNRIYIFHRKTDKEKVK